ncbi:MAG: hypothetical protein E4H20_09965, partial [Spirochaetales bacterium]
MLSRDAGLALAKLMSADAWSRIRIRLRLWAVLSLAIWSLATLASVVLDYPALVYHALVMTMLGSLPVFMFFPYHGEPFLALVRGVDRKSTLEAWLAYRSGPALPLLTKRAEELLRIRSLYSRPHTPVGFFVPALAFLGLSALILAQILSIAAGYGMSLGYADKSALAEAARDEWQSESTNIERTLVVPSSEKPEAPQAGLRERPSGEAESRIGSPSTALHSRRPGNEPVEPGAAARSPSPVPAAGTGDGPESPGSPDAGGTDAGTRNSEGIASGESSRPGFRGSGSSLLPSPLLDYRAVFESQVVERTGK